METTVYVVLTSEDPHVYSYEFYAVFSTRERAENLAKWLREHCRYADAIITESVLH